MVMDSNFINHLKNGYYAFKGAMNINGNTRILVFDTKKMNIFTQALGMIQLNGSNSDSCELLVNT